MTERTESVGKPPLETCGLSKAFDGVLAVSDVSVNLKTGEVTAFIGPNGAGKTTLFHLLSGALRPDAGLVEISGAKGRTVITPEGGPSSWQLAQQGVGRLFQDIRVFGRLSVLENVMLGFQQQLGESPFSAILRWRDVLTDEKLHREKALQLLEQIGLVDHAMDLAEELSYGQQKLLAITRLLATGASILLLDEPTAGLNPTMVEYMMNVVRSLAKGGKTVGIIEHNMDVVADAADRVYFMQSGKVTHSGRPDDVLENSQVRSAYIGLD